MMHGDTTLIKLVFCLNAPSSCQWTFHYIFLKMKERNYYWLLINKDQHQINANMKWERDLLHVPEKNTYTALFLPCEKYLQR